MKILKYGVLTVLWITLGGCGIIQQSEKDAEQIANRPLPQGLISELGYTTKPEVRSIVEWDGLYNWQPVDDYSLIIWPNAFKQYLVTVKEICPNLRYADGIAVTNTNGEIEANFDSVVVGGGVGAGAQRCVINKIYPLKKTGNN